LRRYASIIPTATLRLLNSRKALDILRPLLRAQASRCGSGRREAAATIAGTSHEREIPLGMQRCNMWGGRKPQRGAAGRELIAPAKLETALTIRRGHATGEQA